MAEVNTAEADNNAALAEASFGAGFDGTPVAATPPAAVPEKPVAEPVAQPVTAPEKPKYARVLEKDWSDLRATAGRLPLRIKELEGRIAELTGSMPKADALIQQVIEKVQSQTPAGLAVQFDDGDFAEIAEDYPELVDRLKRVLNKGKVKGTAPAEGEQPKPAAATLDQETLDKAVETALSRKAEREATEKREAEAQELIKVFPDWGKIVGQPFAMGTTEPVNTPWRAWATTNDPDALTTDSPAVVMASITKFNDSLKTAAPAAPPKPDKAEARRALLADAVQPRADGNAPMNTPPSVEDAFAEGFHGPPR